MVGLHKLFKVISGSLIPPCLCNDYCARNLCIPSYVCVLVFFYHSSKRFSRLLKHLSTPYLHFQWTTRIMCNEIRVLLFSFFLLFYDRSFPVESFEGVQLFKYFDHPSSQTWFLCSSSLFRFHLNSSFLI